MAEEWGSVVIKASDDVVSLLQDTNDGCPAAIKLGQDGQIAEDKIRDVNCGFHEFDVKDGYAQIRFHCSDWKQLSELFVRDAANVEWYATVFDEYGTADFYLLNGDGERFHRNFDMGGDLCDIDGYVEEVQDDLAKWESLVPEVLKKGFPAFVDTSDIEFDGP